MSHYPVILACVSITQDQAATGARWIIEQTQLVRLPLTWQQRITAANGSIIMADTAADFEQNGSNAEHYTTVAPCTQLMMEATYVAKCLSLQNAPPPAGTYALYDNESWKLTPASEYDAPCQAAREAADLIRGSAATPVISIRMDTRYHVECAAMATGDNGILHIGFQSYENDLAAYMGKIRQTARWARAALPGITVSFGVSTNPKYNATAWKMWQAWLAATSYLGITAPCWLNIVPVKDTEVTMAARFLGHVYG
jgi:hypothetical protein